MSYGSRWSLGVPSIYRGSLSRRTPAKVAAAHDLGILSPLAGTGAPSRGQPPFGRVGIHVDIGKSASYESAVGVPFLPKFFSALVTISLFLILPNSSFFIPTPLLHHLRSSPTFVYSNNPIIQQPSAEHKFSSLLVSTSGPSLMRACPRQATFAASVSA